MYTLYESYYGASVKIEVSAFDKTGGIFETQVLCHTGSYWKEFLTLSYVMNEKSVRSSSCFNGGDWELFKNIAEAQAEAFNIHGKSLKQASLYVDLKEVK